jgi:hypothetical protein
MHAQPEAPTPSGGDAVSKHEALPDVLVFQFGDVQIHVPFEIGYEYAKALAANEERSGILHFSAP